MTMKSLADYNKASLSKEFGRYLREPWYFESFVDKMALLIMGILALWKIAGWIF